MRIHILTLFPEILQGPLQASLLGRAIGQGLVDVRLCNIRDYALDKHKTVDDKTYGGGPGMLMKPEPLFAAVEAVQAVVRAERGEEAARAMPVVLLSPQGRLFTQQLARGLAQHPELVLLCGRYEGVDERVREHLATMELSIGDYVLSGGEPAAFVVVDAVARLLPGVLGNEASLQEDSLATGLLQYPQYTRPPQFRDWKVPEILLSGNHPQVARWRRQQSLLRTSQQRPDLLEQAVLTAKDLQFLEELRGAS